MNALSDTRNSIAVMYFSGHEPEAQPPRGGFGKVSFHQLPDLDPDTVSAQLAAVDLASEAGAEWMIVLAPGVSLSGEAFKLVAPALTLHDAIFGAAHVLHSEEPVSRLTRLAFDTADRLPHALLNWWVPQTHMVRTRIARHILGKMAGKGGANWWLDYLFELWREALCLKSAQPLLELDAEPQGLGAEGRSDVLRRLAEEPIFLPIVHGDTVYHLPYTGRNAGIEREQSRGQFFEAMELEELRKVITPGARILDVGANTGNHTIFFAGPMKAGLVVPFEPFPDAAAALRASVKRNGLTNVDLSHLDVGVSDRAGRATLVFSVRGGLGATSLVSDAKGEIGVATLDSMISGPIDFLKIDVEGMEMNALAGAARLIAQSKPLIFIEIANANTTAFVEWLRAMEYKVLRIFTDKGHANYLIAPEGRA